MKEQEASPIVPQRNINPDQLKKKIDQIPDLDEMKNKEEKNFEENGLKLSKKGSVLDGAVNITGGPTIRSIKNLRNKHDLKMKMKNEIIKKKLVESIKMPQPVQQKLKKVPTPYVPPTTYKYVPVTRIPLQPVKPQKASL